MEAISYNWPLLVCASLAMMGERASAQEAANQKTPIYLSATAEKALGKTFVFELKEQLRQSSAMRLVVTDTDASRQMLVVAMDINREDSIAYSVVWTWRQANGVAAFEDMVVGVCPSSQLDKCARSIIAQTDEAIAEDSKMWADAIKEAMRDKPTSQK